MKRASYIAGIAGIAPAAFGVTAPTAIHAIGAGYTANASTRAASSTSPSASGQTGCAGQTEFYTGTKGNIKGHGWYKDANGKTCIGTFVASMKFNKTLCKSVIISVFGPYGANSLVKKSARICGVAGKTYHHSFGVHKEFQHFPTACVLSTYNLSGVCDKSV